MAGELSVALQTVLREEVSLVAAGRTDRQIAAALFVSPHTARTHVGHILAKLGVETRTAAAVYAHAHGLA